MPATPPNIYASFQAQRRPDRLQPGYSIGVSACPGWPVLRSTTAEDGRPADRNGTIPALAYKHKRFCIHFLPLQDATTGIKTGTTLPAEAKPCQTTPTRP